MINNLERGYTLQSSYSELYWKFPRFLLKNPKYKKLKDSSKIAYMLFKDRIPLAINNKWFNEDGILYLLFSQKELMDTLNCYQGKVRSTLAELENFKLLHIEQGKFNPKKGKNEQNKYYLLQPELDENDVFYSGNTGYAEIARRSETDETIVNTGYAEIARRIKTPEIPVNTGYAEIAHDINISKTDTLKEDTKNKDTREQQQETYLLNHFAETHEEHSFLNRQNLELIGLFSDTLADAENMQGIILRAKKDVEKKQDAVLILDDGYLHDETLAIQEDIRKTLHRIYQKRKTDSTIKNIDNYTFGAFKNLFEQKLGEWKMLTGDTQNTVAMHDWVK